MDSSVNHEQALVRAFIDPRRQERYLEFVTKPKTRDRFLKELGHFKHLNPKFVVNLKPSDRGLAGIMKILKSKGAGDRCRVLSENGTFDGHEVDLQDALEVTIGRGMGTFLSAGETCLL
jgi:hypothetical protein